MRTAVQVVLALTLLLCGCRPAPSEPPAPVAPAATPTVQADVKAAFDKAYADWLAYIPRFAMLSYLEPYTDCEPFRRMVALGPPALPLFMDRLGRPKPQVGFEQYCFVVGVNRVAKRQFAKEEWAALPDRDDASAVWLKWWQAGAAGARRDFDTRLTRWHESKGNAESVSLWTQETLYLTPDSRVRQPRPKLTPAGEAYQAVQDLGLAILPFLVEQFEQGNYGFVDMAYALTDNQPPPPELASWLAENRAQSFLAWWAENQAHWTIPWPQAAVAAGG